MNMLPSTPRTSTAEGGHTLTVRLQELADRAVTSRRTHGVVLGVEFDDGSASVRIAAGDATADATAPSPVSV